MELIQNFRKEMEKTESVIYKTHSAVPMPTRATPKSPQKARPSRQNLSLPLVVKTGSFIVKPSVGQ